MNKKTQGAMKLKTIEDLVSALDNGHSFQHRGFPVYMESLMLKSPQRIPTRWEGSSGYYIAVNDLPEVMEVEDHSALKELRF